MSDFVKRCVLARAKRNAGLFVGLGGAVSVLLLAGGMLSGVPGRELWGALLPLGTGAVITAGFGIFQGTRFVRMVRRQEEVLGISVSEEVFVPLHPKHASYQASRQWFMCTGSWAFCRSYVTGITRQVHGTRTSWRYVAHVETVEGKVWKLQMESASELKAFCQWYKNTAS